MVLLLMLAAQVSGDPARAVVELQQAIKADPSKESNYTDLGNLLLRTQNFNEAAIVLEHTRKRFPQSAQAALSLGVAYYGQRKFPEAVATFIDSARLDPDAEQPVAFLGRVMEYAESRRDDAAAVFAEFAKRHPKNYLGAFLLGKANQSEADLRRAIELNPRFWEAHFELGCVLQAKRDWVNAMNAFRRASELAPEKPTPHYRMAQIYDRTGHPDAAASKRRVHERLVAEEKTELDRRQAATKHMEIKVQP